MLGKSDISEFKFEEENFKLSIRTNSYNSKAPVAMPQMVAAPLAPAPIAPAPVAAPAAVAPATVGHAAVTG